MASVIRAGAIYGAANAISAGVPFLLLPVLTRVLSPVEYGGVVNFFLLMSACSAIAGLSVHGAVGVAWFRREADSLPHFVGSALGIAVTSTLLVALLLAIIFDAAGSIFGISPATAAMAAIAAGSNVVLQCRLVLWQSQQRPLPSAALQVTASALNMAFSLFAVLWLHWGGQGRNVGATAALVLMACVAVWLLLRAGDARAAVRRADVGTLIAFGLPLVPHALAGVLLSTADRFVVSSQLGPGPLGLYGAAAQLGAVMAVLADAFVKAFNPWLFQRLARKEPLDLLQTTGAMYLAVPGFLLLAAGVGVAIAVASSLFLGPSYREAVHVIPWFMLGGAFTGMYLAVSGLYFFSGRTALLSSISVPAGVIGTLGTVGLVQAHGLWGAAAGYAITQGLLAAGAWIVGVHAFDLPWRNPAMAISACWQRRVPCAGGRREWT